MASSEQPTQAEVDALEAYTGFNARVSTRLAEIATERGELYRRIEDLNKEEYHYISAVLNDNEKRARFMHAQYTDAKELRTRLQYVISAWIGVLILGISFFQLAGINPFKMETSKTEIFISIYLVFMAVSLAYAMVKQRLRSK